MDSCHCNPKANPIAYDSMGIQVRIGPQFLWLVIRGGYTGGTSDKTTLCKPKPCNIAGMVGKRSRHKC